MNYKVGDEVVCIDAMSVTWRKTGLTVGKNYVVLAAEYARCCGMSSIDVGLKSPTGSSVCHCGGTSKGTWHAAWRFIKLDRLTQDQDQEEEATA